MSEASEPNEPMTQSEARAKAENLRRNGIPATARAVPLGSWGGQEKGWDVFVNDEPMR